MLDKRSRNILYIFGGVLLLILITEISRPVPINWMPSYTSVDKIPFGSYVFFEELEEVYGSGSIERIESDPFVFLSEETQPGNAAYIFINDYLDFDERQLEELLEFVNNGNTIFMSANYFGAGIEDSLGFYAEIIYDQTTPTFNARLDPEFFSPSFKADTTLTFEKGVRKTVFSRIDTVNTRGLGYYRSETRDSIESLNFIEVTHGKGKFLINTLPEAFSNYYMLQPQHAYTANLISFIPPSDRVYWDSYLKSGKRIVTSPMRYVFNQDPLRWAYYLLIIGLILYVIFRAKREQRIIEVVKPLENSSVDFTRTIGQMYFQHRDYGNIIAKKINYFLEIVRSKFYLDSSVLDETFAEKLAMKSGNNTDKTKKLIRTINHFKAKAMHSEADLLELNKLLEEFRT